MFAKATSLILATTHLCSGAELPAPLSEISPILKVPTNHSRALNGVTLPARSLTVSDTLTNIVATFSSAYKNALESVTPDTDAQGAEAQRWRALINNPLLNNEVRRVLGVPLTTNWSCRWNQVGIRNGVSVVATLSGLDGNGVARIIFTVVDDSVTSVRSFEPSNYVQLIRRMIVPTIEIELNRGESAKVLQQVGTHQISYVTPSNDANNNAPGLQKISDLILQEIARFQKSDVDYHAPTNLTSRGRITWIHSLNPAERAHQWELIGIVSQPRALFRISYSKNVGIRMDEMFIEREPPSRPQ